MRKRDAVSGPVLIKSRLPRTQAAAVQRHCSASSAAHRTPATQESKRSGSTGGESRYAFRSKAEMGGRRRGIPLGREAPAGADPALFRLRRGICDYLAGAGRGELLDRTLFPVALTVTPHRGHLVVVRRLRLDRPEAHAEDRVGMTPVQPDVRFCRLVQVFWIRAVMYYGEVIVRTPRVIGCPPHNRQIAVSRFELWSLGNPDSCSLRVRRK